MLSRIFPKQIDNTYQGHGLAIGLFVLIVFVKLIMGANTMINTRDVIQGPDQIPLDSYGAAASAIIVSSFKSWGLGLFLMASLGLLALVRYRAMVPLMYLVLLLENGGRRALQFGNPFHVATLSGRPSIGTMINLALVATLLIGFVLSLGWSNRAGEKREGAV